MYILVWELGKRNKARARAFDDLESACIAILRMHPYKLPDIVIRVTRRVFLPDRVELSETTLSDFMRRHQQLLYELALRIETK